MMFEWIKSFFNKIKNHKKKLLPSGNENKNEQENVSEEIEPFEYISNILENNPNFQELLRINQEIEECKRQTKENIRKIKELVNEN